MRKKESSRKEQVLLFARNFLRHPKMLGSLIPSSRFLIEHLMEQIDWKRARCIVEYGPGVGTITADILERLSPEGKLIVIEMNEDFVQYLRSAFRDPRLHVIHGSAADVDKVLRELNCFQADYIISGIPYTTMPEQVREEVLRKSREVLKPNGALLVYQFTRAVLPHLQKEFAFIRQDFEPLNILPAQLFYCRP